MEISLKNKTILTNISKLFDGKNDAIKFVVDYGSMILEAKKKEVEEELEPEPSKQINK